MIASLLMATALFLSVPGARNPAVTPATIRTTICVSGYSERIRPPVSYTSALKRQLLVSQHLPGTVSDYQLDHAISLAVGGDPRSKLNLWMEPIVQARRADYWEARWHRRICDGSWTLRYAQRVELRYKRDRG